eukprot:761298-Hanusia_phi.AAC.1
MREGGVFTGNEEGVCRGGVAKTRGWCQTLLEMLSLGWVICTEMHFKSRGQNSVEVWGKGKGGYLSEGLYPTNQC